MSTKIFEVHYAVTVYENETPIEGGGGFLTTYANDKKEAKEKVKLYLTKKYKKNKNPFDLKINNVKIFKVDIL